MMKATRFALGALAVLLAGACQNNEHLGTAPSRADAGAQIAPDDNQGPTVMSRVVREDAERPRVSEQYGLPVAQKAGNVQPVVLCVWCREAGRIEHPDCEYCRINTARTMRGQ
jgi:hypothetical protein